MRNRRRHFSCKTVGAILLLDSRQISGSDGDQIETWNDKSGNSNNASQATQASRPTLKTGIIGGQQILRFDGSNDSYGLTNNLSAIAPWTSFFVFSRSASTKKAVSLCVGSGFEPFSCFYFNNSIVYVSSSNSGGSSALAGALSGNTIATTDSGTSSMRHNGVSYNLTSYNLSRENTFSRIGNRPSAGDFSDCDIGFVCLADSVMSDSVKKLVEHSLSYSFKISCS